MNEIVSLPLSASDSGKGIIINSTATPGTLIHTSTLEKDFVWLWLSLTSYRSYLDEPVLVTVLKGRTGDYSSEGVFLLENGKKTLIDSGLLLTNSLELRIFNSSTSTSQLDYDIVANGYVHRRIEM